MLVAQISLVLVGVLYLVAIATDDRRYAWLAMAVLFAGAALWLDRLEPFIWQFVMAMKAVQRF